MGAAIGVGGDALERAEELVRRKVDVLAIDTAHGHTSRVMAAVKFIKGKFPEVQLITGNVATYEGAKELISLGVDGIKVGIGPDPSAPPAWCRAPVCRRSLPSRSAPKLPAMPVYP